VELRSEAKFLSLAFTDLGTSPKPGESWGFKVARSRNGQSLLWLDAPDGAATKALGNVGF